MAKQPETLDIWTDGACSGNPGPGGWGAILKWGDHEKELNGGEAETTNNRMELLAALQALRAVKRAVPIRLHTDSVYLKDGITQWMIGWKANGWRTASKKPVKNKDLWEALDSEIEGHSISWHWVKGHAGDEMNERADALARAGMDPFKPKREPQAGPEPDQGNSAT